MSSLPVSLNINKTALFAPANGKHYTVKDYKRTCAQQPLPVLPRYLLARNNKVLRPPTLYYGHILNEDKLMKVIEENFPDCVVWVIDFPDSESDAGDEDEEWRNIVREKVLVTHHEATLQSDKLSEAFAERFGIPRSCIGILSIRVFATSTGGCEYGLSLGSNQTGFIPRRFDAPILKLFGIEADRTPQWHLDRFDWCWTRIRKTKKSKMVASL